MLLSVTPFNTLHDRRRAMRKPIASQDQSDRHFWYRDHFARKHWCFLARMHYPQCMHYFKQTVLAQLETTSIQYLLVFNKSRSRWQYNTIWTTCTYSRRQYSTFSSMENQYLPCRPNDGRCCACEGLKIDFVIATTTWAVVLLGGQA